MKKILLTGGFGFLGSALYEELSRNENFNVYRFRSSDCDLRDKKNVEELFRKIGPDIVINAAARLGGIGDNQKNPSSYFSDNMLIGMNVLSTCADNKVSRVIQIGTVCSYPKLAKMPFKEECIWNGFPEETNSAYGISKRALIAYSQALSKTHNLQTCTVLLANLYGPGDDFRDGTSHVIPALIKKVKNSIDNETGRVVIWGDGSPTRDFLYVTDAAKIIASLCQVPEISYETINVGTGTERSILEVLNLITEAFNYQGTLIFDESKPNGQPKRSLDISRLKNVIGDFNYLELDKGISNTIEYYVKNQSSIDVLDKKYQNS